MTQFAAVVQKCKKFVDGVKKFSFFAFAFAYIAMYFLVFLYFMSTFVWRYGWQRQAQVSPCFLQYSLKLCLQCTILSSIYFAHGIIPLYICFIAAPVIIALETKYGPSRARPCTDVFGYSSLAGLGVLVGTFLTGAFIYWRWSKLAFFDWLFSYRIQFR
jgi:hypothetical protein